MIHNLLKLCAIKIENGSAGLTMKRWHVFDGEYDDGWRVYVDAIADYISRLPVGCIFPCIFNHRRRVSVCVFAVPFSSLVLTLFYLHVHSNIVWINKLLDIYADNDKHEPLSICPLHIISHLRYRNYLSQNSRAINPVVYRRFVILRKKTSSSDSFRRRMHNSLANTRKHPDKPMHKM